MTALVGKTTNAKSRKMTRVKPPERKERPPMVDNRRGGWSKGGVGEGEDEVCVSRERFKKERKKKNERGRLFVFFGSRTLNEKNGKIAI
jgi:hypothetical protein